MPRLAREGSGADLIRHASTTFMGQVLKADTIMRDAGLQEVVIRDAAIHLDDRTHFAGPSLTITNANWVPLGEGRSKAWMQLRENDGPPWDLTVERRRTPAGDATVTVEVENLPISALAPKLSGADGGPYFRSVLTLQARMAQAEDGSFIGLRSIISTADGKFSLNGTDEVNVDATAVSLVLDATGNRLTIPNAEVRTRTGRVQLEGVADLTEIGNVTLICRVRGGFLPTPIGDTKTVQLTGGGGLARINFSDIGLQVERFDLTTPEGTASVIGQASLGGPTPGLSFALSLSRMPASVARALWPPFVAAKTRGWFDINVKGGNGRPGHAVGGAPPRQHRSEQPRQGSSKHRACRNAAVSGCGVLAHQGLSDDQERARRHHLRQRHRQHLGADRRDARLRGRANCRPVEPPSSCRSSAARNRAATCIWNSPARLQRSPPPPTRRRS